MPTVESSDRVPSGEKEPAPAERTPLLLYDGECGLCNAVVRFLLARDRREVLRFAPLQSPLGRRLLRERGIDTEEFDSLVFVPDFPSTDGRFYFRTDGALWVARELGGAWRVLAVLRVVPVGWRDPFYRLVARLRYRVFGVYRPTPLPKAEWERRFLR